MKLPQQGLSNSEKIHEFHDTAGAPLPRQPQVPQPEQLAFRMTLIQEEYRELSAAYELLSRRMTDSDEPATLLDFAELLHEMADLLYVTYGGMFACGVDADGIFAEVHRANLQKAGGPRRADGKLLKPEGWQPADVAGAIQEQIARGQQ